jgi:halocyanin-like protein
MNDEPIVERRRILRLSGAGLVAALAGCAGSGGGGSDAGGSTGTSGGSTETATGSTGTSGGSTATTAESDGSGGSEFGGWLSDVDNYDGVVDRTAEESVTVQVGTEANGGNYGFSPPAVRVSAGTEVVWEWTGKGSVHNVVERDEAWSSGLTDEAGHTYAESFDSAGTVKYLCVPHESLGMKGVVVVE